MVIPLKNISNLSSNIVTVSSTKTLDFKNVAGSFTATIILQHSTKADVTIENCAFEITKLTAPTDFSFTKITKQYDSGNRFTTNDILGAIRGSKTNYTLKSITAVSPSGIASASGTAPNLSLTMTKAGNFTATIILEHPTKRNVSIPSCEFEITKLPAPTNLAFSKRTEPFVSGGSFTTAEILEGVQGTKTGYTVKDITNFNTNIVTLTPAKALNFKNVIGNFTATITLEHPTKRDVVLTGAEFEITKGAAETLTFQKVSKAFTSGGKFSTADILAGVQGTKDGYTIKDITTLNPTNIATVSAAKELDFSGNLGSFTATIILEHPTKYDATITKAEFEVTKRAAETLTFEKVYKVFAAGSSFTTAEILAGVQGTKTGYTIKSISAVSPNDVARVTGTAPGISLTMSKIGVFTATIVLQHNAKEDVTITGAEFQTYSYLLQVSNDGKVTLKRHVNRAMSIVIPAKMGNTDVTSIGEEAFKDYTTLTAVTIPKSVTSIGNNAFYRCSSLTNVTIGSSVTSIGTFAFYRCSSLTSVTIPNSVTDIGAMAFSNCSSLTSITIPSSASIGVRAFGNCGNLSINRPSLQITNGGAVYSILDITGSLDIPSTINGITVTSIENSAFSSCSNLTSVTIPSSVTSIGHSAFYNCSSLTSITIPNSVTSIGHSAFYNCSSLTSITIPNSVTSIEHSVFRNTSLTSVIIPNKVTSIGYSAFQDCSSLTSVTIPKSVTAIGTFTFWNCRKLTHIYVATAKQKTDWETKLKFGNSAVVEVKP